MENINDNITMNGIDNKKDYYNLNEEELKKAKDNCFILIGKTGAGKTSLLNVIYNIKDIGKVGNTLKSETKESNYYPICFDKNSEKKYFCLIDTPGLYDSEGEQNDEIHLNQLKNLISNEKLKIKGLLYLLNFQNERLENSQIKALIRYNSLFPYKNFWKRIILIFSHSYGDSSGDSFEDMKKRKSLILSTMFEQIINKTQKISNPINFNQIICKYINIYSPAKNEIQKKNNQLGRNEIIQELIKFIELEPLFNKIKILKIKNFYVNKNNTPYQLKAKLIIYYDLCDKIMNIDYEDINFLENDNKNSEKFSVINKNCVMDENGELKYIETEIDNSLLSIWKNHLANLLNPIISIFVKYKFNNTENDINKEKENIKYIISQHIKK